MSVEYFGVYLIEVLGVMSLFSYIGIKGRPERKKQPLEVHEKQIFRGGEARPIPKVEYLTPLVGFLMLFVAIDASILLFITSLGEYFSPIMYISVILFAVMLIGVQVD